MDEFLQQVVDNMRKNEFEVVELHTAQEACDYLNERIAAGKTVGVGGSVSVRATGILEKLQEKGCTVYSHWGVPKEEVNPIRRKAIGADVYLCSANAVTRQGKLVLIDGAGNRAAAVCFGPEQVYFVISHSKVVDGGINTAVARIKKTACPPNARRQGLDTACARTGVCGPDCHDSMCRLTLAVDRAPRGRKITVLFVEETLGY